MKKAIITAVSELALLRYFPVEASAREALMRLLERMVATPEQLGWLTRTMIDQVGEWQGPKELRGVFCTRFSPADGIKADCSAGEFSPAALESKAMLREKSIRSLPPATIHCLKCCDQGVIDVPGQFIKWCGCSAGIKRRQKEGKYMDELEQAARKPAKAEA